MDRRKRGVKSSMIAVSPEFETAVKASVRKWVPRVQITWTDPFIDSTIAVSSTDLNRINYKEQIANLKLSPSYKWAHLDGVLKPDGTYHPAPNPAESFSSEMGWWNAVRCDGSGYWTPGSYPTISVEFAARSILSLLVVGDDIYDEFPVEFEVKIYDASDTLLYTESVNDNDNCIWTKSLLTPILLATRVDLVIIKWNKPNRVLKILECYTSINKIYEGNDIVSMDLLEEREISDGSLPVGNISANELDLVLQNIKLTSDGTPILDPFYYGNTLSYLSSMIKKNRRIIAWLGLILPSGAAEYIKLGVFWSGDWDTTEKSATIKTSCRDRMELLRKAQYSTSSVYEGISAYDLLVILLEDAKVSIPMPDLVYAVDSELEDVIIPYAYFPKQDYFKCLKQIAALCLGQVYMSREDVLTITGPSFSGTTMTPYAITSGDYYDRTQPSKSEEIRNKITVTVQPLTISDDDQDVYTSNDAIIVPASGSITVTAEYSSLPVINSVSVLTDASVGLSITAENYYSWGAIITISNSAATDGTCSLSITGNTLKVENEEIVEAHDDVSISDNGVLVYEFENNHLIQSKGIAETITSTLLASYKTFRKDANVDWRGNPAIELGDKLEIPEYQKQGLDIQGIFYNYKNKISFDGTLKATTDGRKI